MAPAEVGRAGIVQNLCSRHEDFTAGGKGLISEYSLDEWEFIAEEEGSSPWWESLPGDTRGGEFLTEADPTGSRWTQGGTAGCHLGGGRLRTLRGRALVIN